MNKKETPKSTTKSKAQKSAPKQPPKPASKTRPAAKAVKPAEKQKVQSWVSRNKTLLSIGIGMLLIFIAMAAGWYCMYNRLADLTDALENAEERVALLEDKLAEMGSNQERILKDLKLLNSAMVSNDLLKAESKINNSADLSGLEEELESRGSGEDDAGLPLLPLAIAIVIILIITAAAIFFRKSKTSE